MVDTSRDFELGMGRTISRRDFLNGVAVGAVGLAGFRPSTSAAADDPASLTGMRGHGAEAMRVMHAIRDGDFWDKSAKPEASGEAYDLVVVGGGLSGLAAGLLYRQYAGDMAKVLILENNEDFGGHASRNEFKASNGKTLIGYGGSQSLQTPSYFSPVVKAVMSDIGIDLDAFGTWFDADWQQARGLGEAVFFPKEIFGEDRLVLKGEMAADWVPNTPLNDKAKRDLIELIDAPLDYLAGKTRDEKLAILSATTYADFLTRICGYDPQLVTYFQHSTEEYFGIGIDGTTALDAWGNYDPGFDAMDLGDTPYKTMSPSGRLALTDPDDYIYHFPDGNASLARAFVRRLIPGAVSGTTMDELVLQPVDHSKLDLHGNAVRLRCNASVVRVAHDGPTDSAASVTLTYLENGRMRSVSAGHAVLACWHRVIPHITDELPPEQIEALNDQVKIPLVYANVLLRNWQAFDALKISGFHTVGGFWNGAEIDYPVSVGSYRFTDAPTDPVLIHLIKVPLTGEAGVSARDQATAGRYALAELTFEDMEREIRDMLGRALASGGFDPSRDIEAITCNRWSHGYALEYMRPWDAFWPDGPLPIEISRKGWGRIAIANADAGAYAYAHSAIDQAARAVKELLGDKAAAMPNFSDFPGPPRDAIGL